MNDERLTLDPRLDIRSGLGIFLGGPALVRRIDGNRCDRRGMTPPLLAGFLITAVLSDTPGKDGRLDGGYYWTSADEAVDSPDWETPGR
jgi:hypothetical protein